VKKGQNLISVESMKMEYFVKATSDGVVDNVMVSEGQAVQLKQKLVSVSAGAQ
jgi:biotin carboxyl carrier protein